MRVLVAGATGYVGQRLALRLVALGHEVSILIRSDVSLPLEVETHRYDGTSESVLSGLKAARPEIVVNCVADLSKQATPDALETLLRANVTFPAQLAQAASQLGIPRLLNISTYSTSINGYEYRPQTLYAATKKAAEDILTFFHQSSDLRVCTLCFYDVYGPNHHGGRFLSHVIDAMPGGPVVMSPGRQEICFLFIDDAVSALIHAMERPDCFSDLPRNIFTVHGDEIFELVQVPHIVAGLMDVPCPEIRSELPYRSNEIMRFRPEHPRLPGWVPNVRFAEGVRSIMATGTNPSSPS